MGRKKARRSGPKKSKRNEALAKRFSCPECNHENVVVCRIDKSEKKGIAACTVCEATHTCKADKLSAPIDVYTDWVDNTR